ncbi:hypothetical protein ACXWO0_09830, partial [Streptococcus pyogenes]
MGELPMATKFLIRAGATAVCSALMLVGANADDINPKLPANNFTIPASQDKPLQLDGVDIDHSESADIARVNDLEATRAAIDR